MNTRSTHPRRFPRTPSRVVSAIAAGLYAAAISVAHASGPATIPDPNAPWLRHSQSILQRAVQAPAPDWAKPKITEEQREWARKIMSQTQLRLQSKHKPLTSPATAADAVMIRVFLTLGKGESGRARFKHQVEALASRDNVVVELRGLPKGVRRIDQLITLLRSITHSIDNAPPIELAPKRFRQAGIGVAPTVVFYRNDKPVARLTGSLEIDHLKHQIQSGRRGRLGVRGETRVITERDLMSVIKERWAKIDWAAEKKKAIEHYWQQYQPTQLPKADKFKRFTINPTVVVAHTIRGPDGRVIARKGERVNALARVPFTGEIIAFDGRQSEQVKLAKRLADQARAEGLRPILLTQGLPGKPGFDALDDLGRQVGARVYLLDNRVTGRFHLAHLPAVVRSTGTVFEVRELPSKEALRRLARASKGGK